MEQFTSAARINVPRLRALARAFRALRRRFPETALR
jgi:hypothetical protein